VTRTARGIHRFIPDGILFIGDVMWLVEMKFTHTQDAWHQLWNIYGPLVEAAFKGYRLRGYIEVVNSMGPQDSRLPIFDDVDRCLSHHSSIWLAPERWLR